MQKRIRQIAAGKFESDQPSLSISDEELFLTVTEGQLRNLRKICVDEVKRNSGKYKFDDAVRFQKG